MLRPPHRAPPAAPAGPAVAPLPVAPLPVAPYLVALVLVALLPVAPTLLVAAPAQAATTSAGTVRVAGQLTVRSGPGTTFASVGTLANGAKIRISCDVTGPSVRGSVRTSTRWDRLSSGRYVSHGFVRSTANIPTCRSAAPTPMTNAQFIANAVPGAQRSWREFKVPPSVTIAQSILESGWGRSTLAANDRNYFGIKCFGGPGPIADGCRTYRTSECTKAGRCFTTEASFRTYRVAANSFRDHGYFLRTNSRYKPAFAHSYDADEFVRQIRKAGYATDPLYVAKVVNLMRDYNLYRYNARS